MSIYWLTWEMTLQSLCPFSHSSVLSQAGHNCFINSRSKGATCRCGLVRPQPGFCASFNRTLRLFQTGAKPHDNRKRERQKKLSVKTSLLEQTTGDHFTLHFAGGTALNVCKPTSWSGLFIKDG